MNTGGTGSERWIKLMALSPLRIGMVCYPTYGGSGAVAGHGSNVLVQNGGRIATAGTGSYGILAQSIGGGGGNTSTSTSTISSRLTPTKIGPLFIIQRYMRIHNSGAPIFWGARCACAA